MERTPIPATRPLSARLMEPEDRVLPQRPAVHRQLDFSPPAASTNTTDMAAEMKTLKTDNDQLRQQMEGICTDMLAQILAQQSQTHQQNAQPPAQPQQPAAPAPQVPKTEESMPECPTRAQQLKDPVGKIVEGNRKLVAYEMVGKECLPVFEELSIPDQIVQNIPSPGMVTTTASVAVVAASSALLAKPLADLLLKVVKPAVKKVMKKIAALRGKKTPIESAFERRRDQRVRNHAIRKLKGKE